MKTMRDFVQGLVIGFVFGMILVAGLVWDADKRADYYSPAEWLFTTETSSYFAAESGNIYAVDADPSYTGDHPYLLHMDSNNTTDPTDDIVLVVWSTK
mgnify:CR=1 FL=1